MSGQEVCWESDQIRRFLHKKLEEVRIHFGREEAMEDDEAWDLIVRTVFDDPFTKLLPVGQADTIIKKIFYKTRKKLGILDPLIRDPSITEIMVNGPEKIFVEQEGVMKRYPLTFDDVGELEDVIRSIVGEVHREINEMSPIVDARLANGSRVNGVYRNVAVNGPILTIRKFSDRYLQMDDLVANGTLPREAAELLEVLVQCGYNLFVSGGTSSGKTTLLNALAGAIPPEERVIIVEDSMELKMDDIDNIVHMECRNSNASGRGQVTMSDLIRSSLRMRPDRIIVGEVRGPEVMDMLNAMNTGHQGSLSTGHGNSAQGMLKRLESMYLMAMPLNIEAIRAQIAEGIDILVHVEKLAGGSRKVVEITELIGYTDGRFQLNPLMRLGCDGLLTATGKSLQELRKVQLKGERYVNELRRLGFVR